MRKRKETKLSADGVLRPKTERAREREREVSVCDRVREDRRYDQVVTRRGRERGDRESDKDKRKQTRECCLGAMKRVREEERNYISVALASSFSFLLCLGMDLLAVDALHSVDGKDYILEVLRLS